MCASCLRPGRISFYMSQVRAKECMHRMVVRSKFSLGSADTTTLYVAVPLIVMCCNCCLWCLIPVKKWWRSNSWPLEGLGKTTPVQTQMSITHIWIKPSLGTKKEVRSTNPVAGRTDISSCWSWIEPEKSWSWDWTQKVVCHALSCMANLVYRLSCYFFRSKLKTPANF